MLVQKRPVDQFDIDAAVLHRLDRIGDLDQLAGGFLRIGVGAVGGVFSSGRHFHKCAENGRAPPYRRFVKSAWIDDGWR